MSTKLALLAVGLVALGGCASSGAQAKARRTASKGRITSVDSYTPVKVRECNEETPSSAMSRERSNLRAFICEVAGSEVRILNYCKQGVGKSCEDAGETAANDKDFASALLLYQRGCDLGADDACSKEDDIRSKVEGSRK